MQVYSPRDPLGEYLQGKISFRQLRVMVENLPRDNSTPLGRAVNGPWNEQSYMLQALVWEMRRLNANYYNANREKGTEAMEPEVPPVPPLTEYQQATQQNKAPRDERDIASETQLLAVLNGNQ